MTEVVMRERVVHVYVASDGKEFNDLSAAMEYNNKLLKESRTVLGVTEKELINHVENHPLYAIYITSCNHIENPIYKIIFDYLYEIEQKRLNDGKM